MNIRSWDILDGFPQTAQSTGNNTEDEMALDEESIVNRQERLIAKILELESKMREAVTTEREQYRWPYLHGVHLKHLEPRL